MQRALIVALLCVGPGCAEALRVQEVASTGESRRTAVVRGEVQYNCAVPRPAVGVPVTLSARGNVVAATFADRAGLYELRRCEEDFPQPLLAQATTEYTVAAREQRQALGENIANEFRANFLLPCPE